MADLQIACLGELQVTLNGALLTLFQTDKNRALFLYLALEARVHPRAELAQFLWPGYSDESARSSLRQALHQLRQTLADPADTPWLLLTRQTVQLNPDAPIGVDVLTFRHLLATCAHHAHADLPTCAPCLARLRQAVDLYRGDFLAGFTVADSAPFEEWRRILQEQLHVQMLDALSQLAAAAEAGGEDAQALHAARRLLTLEPWLEEAHRQVMRLLARQGQRAAALAQYQQCRQVLAEELGAAPDAETTALYEQIRRGEFDKVTRRQGDKVTTDHPVTPSPCLPVTLSPPHNLPAAQTPLIGRTQALTEIAERLQTPGTRLLTLVGPGGMGKTSLALAAGREQLPLFTDGVWFVPLAAINTAALIPALANALGLALPGGDPRSALLQTVRPKQMLLLLDNFEHLLTDESTALDLVVDLLEAAPRVQIMVTSRERLKLRSEQVYTVQPLPFADNAPLAEAALLPAVRLFVQATQRSHAAFQLTTGNLAAVLRICRLVEGMPLGLELAAANAGGAPLTAIADAIEQSAEFLSVDWRDMPPRQRSMRALFAWSWQLLTPEEQRILRQSAVFRGGFTYAAAQAVTGATLPLLTRLTDKSLLQWQATTTGEGRYVIHELLRQFAAEHLAHIAGEQEAGEQEQVAARHSEFYLNYLSTRERRLTRTEPRAAAAEIQEEIDNLRQAWQCAVRRQDFSALQRSAWALFSFYRHTGSTAEALQAFQVIAAQAPVLARPDLALGQRQPHDPPQSRLIAIYAHLLAIQGKLDQAIVVAQQALTLAQAEEATDAAALSHFCWGQALRLQGRLTDAQPHFAQTLQLASLVTASAVKSELLYDAECLAGIWLGGLAADEGIYGQAREQMERSLRLAQSLGKRRLEMTALINLADIARRMGAYPSARQAYEDALRLAREVGYRWGEGASQLELGEVVRLQGEYSRTAELMENALTILQEIGAHDNKAVTLANLGHLYAYLGDSATAEAWLTCYQQCADEVQGWEPVIEYLQARMVLALHRGEPAQALTYATEGWQIGQTHGLPDMQAYALIGIGHAQRQLGQVAAATTAYQQAFDLYTAIQRPDLAAEAQAGLALLAQQQGDQPRALSLVQAVLAQLAAQPISGQDEPFFLYLTGYQLLAAAQDPRAPTILQQSYTLLQRYAEAITTDALRQSFLENVPVHRALQQAYTALQASATAAPLRRSDGQE